MTVEVGKALREARLRRGVELHEVEAALKIRGRYLRAMEEDAWELLPGTAYESGFLRTTFKGATADAFPAEYVEVRAIGK